MTNDNHIITPDCLGFSDESMFNIGRWRSIALVSVLHVEYFRIKNDISNILSSSSISEFKWKDLKSARIKFGAEKLINYILPECCNGNMRVDVLIWDTYDRRHNVQGRDDNENFQRMYYHIIGHVISKGWNNQFIWELYPDEMLAVDWLTLKDCANFKTRKLLKTSERSHLWPELFKYDLTFRISKIIPTISHEEPLVQLADLFAGMAAYSRNSYTEYNSWKKSQTCSRSLFDDDLTLSNSDTVRCEIINLLINNCKNAGMSVGIDTSQGLKTFNPRHPINFWLYVPQHAEDIAPLRSGKIK